MSLLIFLFILVAGNLVAQFDLWCTPHRIGVRCDCTARSGTRKSARTLITWPGARNTTHRERGKGPPEGFNQRIHDTTRHAGRETAVNVSYLPPAMTLSVMDSTSNTLGGAHVPKSPEEWPSFLRSYADGDWKTDDTCSPVYDPSGSTDSTPVGDQSDTTWNDSVPYETYDYHLYPSTHISKETAERVRQFVIAKDYLPPPRSPLEEHRLECIKQYDIYSEAQTTNIQRAVDVIAAFLPTALVTFTLFDGRKQLFVAMGGDQSYIDRYGLVLRQPIPAHNSLCGHSVLRRDQVMFIPDLRHDFRFRSNPYSTAGISSYIGSPVSLLLDPLFGQQASDLRVGIGSLNVLFIDGVIKALEDKDRMIVENITRMLEAQLRGTWEGVIRTREGMMRYAVSDLIEASFVKEKKRQENESDSKSLAKTQKRADDDFVHLAQLALSKVTAICSALSGVTLVDTQDRSGDKVCPRPFSKELPCNVSPRVC